MVARSFENAYNDLGKIALIQRMGDMLYVILKAIVSASADIPYYKSQLHIRLRPVISRGRATAPIMVRVHDVPITMQWNKEWVYSI